MKFFVFCIFLFVSHNPSFSRKTKAFGAHHVDCNTTIRKSSTSLSLPTSSNAIVVIGRFLGKSNKKIIIVIMIIDIIWPVILFR